MQMQRLGARIAALSGGAGDGPHEAHDAYGGDGAPAAGIDRRTFLKLTGMAGGGLALGIAPLSAARADEGAASAAPHREGRGRRAAGLHRDRAGQHRDDRRQPA
ncbi:hypothetical protein OJJOAM_002675 [Cupriavidus sp. H18C1]